MSGIEFFRKSQGGRFILGLILNTLENIGNRLRRLDIVKKVELAGSVRRMRESIGDADYLAVSNEPSKVMDFFTSMPDVAHIQSKGMTKSTVRLRNGIECDLRIVLEESFGAALQYFTGSKQHSVVLRTIALRKGYKLNEYGLYNNKGNRLLAGRLEEDIYSKLGLAWISPELREDKGEIEAARDGRLPKLICYNSLKGDLQMHTKWTDGNNSIEEMAQAAKSLGLEYIAITDHSRTLGIARGLTKERVDKQMKEIKKINQTISDSKIRVLSGIEVNILKDGNLDLENSILEDFDIVGAAIHSHFTLPKKEQTKRLIAAMYNPNVDIIFHPTGRRIQQRRPIDLDIEQIMEVSKKTNTILEVDSSPERLDLPDEYIRLAIQNGCKLAIDSDAHDRSQMHFVKFGIAQARRGWAKEKDIINTLPVEKFLKSLK